jgi:hypothetical protein
MAAVFWDLENCQIPAKSRLANFYSGILGATLGPGVRVDLEVVAASQIHQSRLSEFERTSFIRETGFGPSKNAADDKLKSHMIGWMDTNPRGTTILISGDKGFLSTLKQMKVAGQRIIVVCHGYNGHKELIEAFDYYDIDNLGDSQTTASSNYVQESTMTQARSQQEQQSSGSGSGWGWLFGAVAVVAASTGAYLASQSSKKDDDAAKK